MFPHSLSYLISCPISFILSFIFFRSECKLGHLGLLGLKTFGPEEDEHRTIYFHWGQGPKYPPGTCWIHWEYRQQVTPMCPVGKSWVYWKCTHKCGFNLLLGEMLIAFGMYPVMWPQCTQFDGSPTFWTQGDHIGKVWNIQNVSSMYPSDWSHGRHIANLIGELGAIKIWLHFKCIQPVPAWANWSPMTGDI